jgi:crossover junction endodeoxyribonuclease RuvC
MKIVGIDASLTGTGIAILNSSLRTECIQTGLTGSRRLVDIRERVRSIVEGAELVVLEGYAFARPNQAHQIGELGGVLRVLFYEMGLKVIEVAPSAVKKYATGKGNAKKEDIAVAIYKRWGREFKTNDEADAFVLAVIGKAYQPGLYKEAQTAFQREVIEGLRKGPKKKRLAKKAG